ERGPQSPWESTPSEPWGPLVFLPNLWVYLAVLPEGPESDRWSLLVQGVLQLSGRLVNAFLLNLLLDLDQAAGLDVQEAVPDFDQDLQVAPAGRSTAVGELTGTRTTEYETAELASSMGSWSGWSWTADTLRPLPSALMGSPP